MEVTERVEVNASSIVGVDFGMSKPFAASRVHSDGSWSGEYAASIHTDRASSKERVLDTELTRVVKKNKARESRGVVNNNAIRQVELLRAKLRNVREYVDWNSASDLLAIAQPNEALVIENLTFNSGGAIKFRHSSYRSKLEHKSAREGRTVRVVNAAYSSKTCPSCDARVEADKVTRITTCACGWVEDRDLTASVELARRGFKKKPTLTQRKGKPTRKQVRRAKKFNNRIVVGVGSAGFTPKLAVGVSVAPIPSLTGLVPASHSLIEFHDYRELIT